MFIRFVRVVITAFYAVFHPLRVEGRERIPGEGAFILALNHTSFLDAFTAFLLLPNDAKYMAKKELFRALNNFRRCLERINSQKNYDAFLHSGFPVLLRDEKRTPEETLRLAAEIFELA